MIFTLIGADFSKSNIGTLSSWIILRELGAGATYTGPSFVEKNATFSATVTLSESYEIGSAGITITMGGIALDESCYSVTGNVITFTIASVTGSVVIKVPTLNIDTGEGDVPSCTFTINPTPANATVTLTASNSTQTGNSITVFNDTTVSWSVNANGYIAKSGTYVVTSDYTMDVALISNIVPILEDNYIKSNGQIVKATGQSAGGWSISDYAEVINGKSFKYTGTVPEGGLETVPYCVWGYDANKSPVKQIVTSTSNTYLTSPHVFTVNDSNIKYIVACGFVRNGEAFSLEYV
mgnify:CR=1 FL=1